MSTQLTRPAGDNAVLDAGRLESYRKRRPGFLERLIAAYLDEAPKHVTGIKVGIAAGDQDAVKIAAHTLKSSSANLGAIRLAELCQSIESAAVTNDRTTLADLADGIGSEWFAAEQALRTVMFEQRKLAG